MDLLNYPKYLKGASKASFFWSLLRGLDQRILPLKALLMLKR